MQLLEHLNNPFFLLVLLLVLSVAVGLIMLRLHLPSVIGFMLVGIVLGPSVPIFQSLDIGHNELVELFAEIGVALLLFIVGLKFDISTIKTTGPSVVGIALAEASVVGITGFCISHFLLHFEMMVSLYIAAALIFSSTIVVVKILSDRGDESSLFGRLTVGIVIIEDLLVIMVMIAFAAMARGSGESITVKDVPYILLLASLFAFSFMFMPRIIKKIMHSTELLILFSITYGLLFASLGDVAGIGKEVGAFLAGVSLASTSAREILASKMVVLRDFMLLFFFIQLGIDLNISKIGEKWWMVIVFIAFVMIVKPTIIMLTMAIQRYTYRTSFFVATSLTQISEFSLILMASGQKLGAINDQTFAIIALATMVTMAVSVFMMSRAELFYRMYRPVFGTFFKRADRDEQAVLAAGSDDADIIIIGLGNFGSKVGQHFLNRGAKILGVDFDPEAIKRWNGLGGKAMFGDAEDIDFMHFMPLHHSKWILCTVNDNKASLLTVKNLLDSGYSGRIAVSITDDNESIFEAEKIKELADFIFIPSDDAANKAVDNIFEWTETLERMAMDTKISELTNHYIICGYGRMGKQIGKDLSLAGVQLVVIEDNHEQLPALRHSGILHIDGAATDDEVLIQAGINKAKGLISVTQTDEENVFIVLTARGLNPNLFIVTRSILEENADKLKRAGADRVVSPYILGGRRIASAVVNPRIVDFVDLLMHSEDFGLYVNSIKIDEDSPYVDKKISDCDFDTFSGEAVVAIKHQGNSMESNPCGNTMISAGDEIILMTTDSKECNFD